MQTTDLPESSLSLKEMIRRVQSELTQSHFERKASGIPALFEVERLTLEVNFVVTKSKGASGGFDLKVLTFGGIKADADFDHQEQQTHKIVLSLKVTSGHDGFALKFQPAANATD